MLRFVTPDDLLAQWKRLAGDPSPSAWQPENAYGFFQTFRPLGDGVDEALVGVPHAAELTGRLVAVYRATASGWRRGNSEDLYCVVRDPARLEDTRAIDLVRQHLAALASMALDLDLTDPSLQLDPTLPVDIIRGAPAPPIDRDGIETALYELQGDWFDARPFVPLAHAMREAMYSLACDYPLAHFVLWPLVGDGDRDLYAAYFDLWRHGAELRAAPAAWVVHLPR
jgi:hypothetical protein